ncbi:hypothetical protein GCWU000321_01275 [Dialister invisus DSM 15470]|uniref:Uncharacterized protein n=1 Tax=Dialister invisus DSM 15470 TaxID=592028 RepID=C9LP01_9FIRM|nr:hypothetical protein GCWU000321_01275 [Dialister invisus DSM 15470]
MRLLRRLFSRAFFVCLKSRREERFGERNFEPERYRREEA